MKLVYTLKNITTLEYALELPHEIKAEVGLTPDYVETDQGDRVNFDRTDFKRLEKGDIADADYIAHHRILVE